MKYIIIQAGGKGSRLLPLTLNKPKALVSYKGKPFIFNTFERFPKAKFIIIGDYKFDVLASYLKLFASQYDITLVKATQSGTLSGLKDAINFVTTNHSFMIIWCDLILGKNEKFSFSRNTIKLSNTFNCRWSYKDNLFLEESSNSFGVAGCFIFKNKEGLDNLPENGEFVRWLSMNNFRFKVEYFKDTKEIGELSKLNVTDSDFISRPFNKVLKKENSIIKIPLNKFGKKINADEILWYKFIANYNFPFIPNIENFNPLKMRFIDSIDLINLDDITLQDFLLKKIINNIYLIHQKNVRPYDRNEILEVYFNKTFDRINKVKDLIPFNNNLNIKINNTFYKNPLFFKEDLKNRINSLESTFFSLIHGDITLSNVLFDATKKELFFIDPRGYFGQKKIFGDPLYDWSKLFYSIFGNYDNFNRKKFSLIFKNDEINLNIQKNNWTITEDSFFSLINVNKNELKLIHGLLWLSLTTYVWDDYDSICAAFYKGCMELNGLI
jgi:GTP:adenosylcobinamide-phosphate guanylyltransferase